MVKGKKPSVFDKNMQNPRTKRTILDYWNKDEFTLAIGGSSPNLFAIGKEIDRNTTQWIHLKRSDVEKFLRETRSNTKKLDTNEDLFEEEVDDPLDLTEEFVDDEDDD